MFLTEELLHYLWKFRLFPQKGLTTTDGRLLQMISPGVQNEGAGPDFYQAKIQLEEELLVGTVEIHLSASDWERHHHHVDPAYNTVILHVVYKADRLIFRQDGTPIPMLGLQHLISDKISLRYQQLMRAHHWIPCQRNLPQVDELYVKMWLSRVLIERFEKKYQWIQILLKYFKGSWEDAFYIALARNFGFKTNALPFEWVAKAIPLPLIAKHKSNPLQIEALFLGQAGFLNSDLKDDYPKQLRAEYDFLRKKYKLIPLDKALWKLMRVHPQNFPALRLAQFAALMVKSDHLFSQIIAIDGISALQKIFEDLPIHSYWHMHYQLDIESAKFSAQLGEQSVTNLLINTVSIFLFAYGKYRDAPEEVNRGILLLEQLASEHNKIVRGFKKLGITIDCAAISQALLQLKTDYCDQKRCLHCGIGMKLLGDRV